MSFGMITLNQSNKREQNYATRIMTALLFMSNRRFLWRHCWWLDTSNYDEDYKRPLPAGKNEKTIGIFKDELGGKIMKEFVGLRAKPYACLMEDDTEHKKAKETKKGIIKRELTFKNCDDCLFNDKTY